MLNTIVHQSAEEFQLKEVIALNHRVDRESVLVFGVLETFLAELFKNFYTPQSKLITAAPTIPQIDIAADRAEIELVATHTKSPFAADIDSISQKIESSTEIVYLANPNRLTGASYSNLQIKQLAKSVERGILIVDEYYTDFSRLTALPLTGMIQNLVILRSFGNWPNAGQTDCGYAIVSEELLESLDSTFYENRLERSTVRKCLDIFTHKKSTIEQVNEIQKQSLEITSALSNLGLRCQIAPTNFVIIHTDNADSTRQGMLANGIDLEVVKLAGSNSEFLIYRISTFERSRKLEQAFMKFLSKNSIKLSKQTVTV